MISIVNNYFINYIETLPAMKTSCKGLLRACLNDQQSSYDLNILG